MFVRLNRIEVIITFLFDGNGKNLKEVYIYFIYKVFTDIIVVLHFFKHIHKIHRTYNFIVIFLKFTK